MFYNLDVETARTLSRKYRAMGYQVEILGWTHGTYALRVSKYSLETPTENP